jgi:DNA-binding transcriptional ArsR family regulator
MIRQSAWVFIILMLVVAASPATAFAIPAGATKMPMNGGSGHHGGSQSSGCNCNMPLQPATAMARAEPPVRTTSGPCPCNGTAVPVINTTSMYGRFSGIRRICPKNVLDHPERAAVYTTITEHPGIDLNGIAAEHGMNRETLRYHLDQLESAVKIVVMRDRGIVRYYENHGRYSPLERSVLWHTWNPTAKEILARIVTKPGITQSELSTHLALTAPTVRWYMHRFRDDGLIVEQHRGRYTHYVVVPEVTRYVRTPVAAEQPPATLVA